MCTLHPGLTRWAKLLRRFAALAISGLLAPGIEVGRAAAWPLQSIVVC